MSPTADGSSPRPARAVGFVAGLLAAGLALHVAARGELAAPPLTTPAELGPWLDARDPVAVLLASVRLVAEGTTWYLLGLTGLHALARAVRVPAVATVADLLGLPGARRLVRFGLGVGVAAATTLGPEAATSPAAVTMAPVLATPVTMDPLAATAATQAPLPSPTGTASMRPVDARADDPPPTPPGTATMQPVAPAPAPGAPAPTAAPTPTTWTVVAGESLWTIAEDLVGDALGRPATDAEVDPHWRRLVERNRPRLVDPDDPDLILPGQVLEVPALDTGTPVRG